MKVFVVDDDRIMLKLLSQSIEKAGSFEVSCYRSGNECLDNLHRVPDIVFLDHHLPGVKGLDVVHQIKNRLPLCDIVMVSGTRDIELVHEAFSAGVADFVLKSEKGIREATKVLAELASKRSSFRFRFKKWWKSPSV